MHKLEGIILKTSNFEETSHILTVFSKEYGLTFLVTKNYATKIGRSLSPLLKIETSVKSTQKELWKAGHISIIDSYASLRLSFDKLKLAAQLSQIVMHMIPPKTQQEELYHLFDLHLDALARKNAPFAVAASFLLKFFHLEGMLPAIPTDSIEQTQRFESLFYLPPCELEAIACSSHDIETILSCINACHGLNVGKFK